MGRNFHRLVSDSGRAADAANAGGTNGTGFAGEAIGDVISIGNSAPAPRNFTELQAAASQVGADTVIDLGGGDTITLLGVNVGLLAADNFLF